MTTKSEHEGQQFGFKAEIRQVLNILVHSLYKDRDIFLRELISNASDALTRLHFEHLTNQDVLDRDVELAIHLNVETDENDKKVVIIKDTGIGMTDEELVRNLGTIAQSGAKEFLATVQQQDNTSAKEIADVIGQFGVGFYSVFMVADRVDVISRSYKPDAAAARWTSDGGESFEVFPAEKPDRGTEIRVHLRDDAQEYGDNWKLKQIVKKHSDFVSYPIYVDGDQANRRESLWRRQPSQVENEEYNSFYQQLTLDFEEPLTTVHLHADAPVNVRALLYVPAKREQMFSSRTEPGVKLYSKNVLIQEYCPDLLPKWLEFVDGVVDSEDLPLNVSRETVQNNRLMRHLGETLKKRVIREIKRLENNEENAYDKFWNEFGRVLKEGLALDPESKEDILPLLRYKSSTSEGNLRSLDDYIESMPESQESIYYVLADTPTAAATSPHLDPFRTRDIEVLYWTDPLDSFISPLLNEYREKAFRNIDDAGLELPDAESDGDDEAAIEEALEEPVYNRLVSKFVSTLGDKVIEVRSSKVLKDSPVRLVSPADAPNREMQRVQRMLNQEYEIPKRILELNRQHPLIVSLAHKLTEQPDSELVPVAIEQLYEGALVQEGLHPNPAEMLPRILKLMEIAAR